MSVIVDFEYYSENYMGTDAEECSFPTLFAHSSRIIGALTRWQVTESNISGFHSSIQELYKNAICAQIDFLAINGIDSLNSMDGGGFTVGKVTVQGKASTVRGGAMSESISPVALMLLEQSGLMNPAIPVMGGCLC